MDIYTFNNKRYYLLNDIRMHNHASFSKLRGLREFVTYHKLKAVKEYVSARFNGKDWEPSDGASLQLDKFFIRSQWIHDYGKVDEESDTEEPEPSETDEQSGDESSADDSDDEDVSETEALTNIAPLVISLKKKEQFKDAEGKAIKIETRGVRETDGCYFSVKDASVGFEMPSLYKTLINKKTGYAENKHYQYFNVPDDENNSKHSKMKYKREMFLTFPGLMRLMYVSSSGITEAYTNWANDILFAMQMGTREQKALVAANALDVAFQAVMDVFSKSAMAMPGVYMLYLGKVKDLRKAYNIPKSFKDDESVYKFGRSDDLRRRFRTHFKNYAQQKGYDLLMSYFCIVDPKYLSEAETDVKHYFIEEEFKLDHSEDVELAIFPDKKKRTVQRTYKDLCKPYVGCYRKIVARLKRRENTIELLKETIEKLNARLDAKETKIELQETKLELQEERYERKLSEERSKRKAVEKELEICELKLQLATKSPSKSSTTKHKHKSKSKR